MIKTCELKLSIETYGTHASLPPSSVASDWRNYLKMLKYSTSINFLHALKWIGRNPKKCLCGGLILGSPFIDCWLKSKAETELKGPVYAKLLKGNESFRDQKSSPSSLPTLPIYASYKMLQSQDLVLS